VGPLDLDLLSELLPLGNVEKGRPKKSVHFHVEGDVVPRVELLIHDERDELDDAVVEHALELVDCFEGETVTGLDGEAVFVDHEVELDLGLLLGTLFFYQVQHLLVGIVYFGDA